MKKFLVLCVVFFGFLGSFSIAQNNFEFGFEQTAKAMFKEAPGLPTVEFTIFHDHGNGEIYVWAGGREIFRYKLPVTEKGLNQLLKEWRKTSEFVVCAFDWGLEGHILYITDQNGSSEVKLAWDRILPKN